MFAEARLDVTVNPDQTVKSLRHLWRFDDVFSSTVLMEFDKNSDLKLDDTELEDVAQTIFTSLAEYNYFQLVTVDGKDVAMKPPAQLMANYENDQLIVLFESEPKAPLKLDGKIDFGVYDPTFYTAIDFTEDDQHGGRRHAGRLHAAGDPARPRRRDRAEQEHADRGLLQRSDRHRPEQDLRDQARARRAAPRDDPVSKTAVRIAFAAPDHCLCGVAFPDACACQSSLGIGTNEATLPSTGLFAHWINWINVQQQQFYRALTGALKAMRTDGSKMWLLVGLSFTYGIFHAAGPGHGKAVISSYMLANEVALRRGILLSFVSAFLQAFTAIAVMTLVFLVLRGTAISMTDATWFLEVVSYALISAFGAWLLWKKAGPLLVGLFAGRPAHSLSAAHAHSHSHAHGHSRTHPRPRHSRPRGACARPRSP